MSKKPSFANLSSRLNRKPSEESYDPTEAPVLSTKRIRAIAVSSTETTPAAERLRQTDGRRGILVRARPEAWKALKQIALDGERTLQDVMTEAINDILVKSGKPPVA